MKQIWLTLGIVIAGITFLYAQADDVLFCIGDKTILKKEALETLSARKKTEKIEISTEEFNRILNFYLSIHDFKVRQADTTKVFKRKLESQFITVFGSVFSSENHQELLNKCMISGNSFPVVTDLFVPFEPILLREIEGMRQGNLAFETMIEYAKTYEGVHVTTRIILPDEENVAMQSASCELLGKSKGEIVGPVKGLKGYHYLLLEREQANFGRFKTQVILISNRSETGKQKINEAFAALKKGEDFAAVVKQYSQRLRDAEDDGVRFFSPSVNMDETIQEKLMSTKEDGELIAPFLASGNWYIIKRISREQYPSQTHLKKSVLLTTRKPSFFIGELKQKYDAKEYPQNFLLGENEILFSVADKAYYAEDFKKYVEEYGYDYTSETYDSYFYHLLVDKYKDELDKERYQKLIDYFYFMEIYKPMILYQQKNDKEKVFLENLRKLVKKYNPEIPVKKYVQNNPVFEE